MPKQTAFTAFQFSAVLHLFICWLLQKKLCWFETAVFNEVNILDAATDYTIQGSKNKHSLKLQKKYLLFLISSPALIS